MQELRPFTEKGFTASTQYDTEFTGRAVRGVGFSFDGTTSGTTTAEEDDGMFRLLGTPRVIQDETDLIHMQGPDWRHLAALLSGGYDPYLGGTDGAKHATSIIDFTRLAPNAAINVANSKLFVRGDYQPVVDGFTGGTPAMTGTLRPNAITLGRPAPQGFLRPKFTQRTVNLGTAATDVQDRIRFDQDVRIAGIMVRALDGKSRVDGLVRRLSVDATSGSGGESEIIRQTWGSARLQTCHSAGFSQADADTSNGVIFLPTLDPNGAGGMLQLGVNDSLTLHFDTSSAAEDQYTAITPGGNETAVVTLLAFSFVGAAGQGGARSERRTASGGRSRGRRPGR